MSQPAGGSKPCCVCSKSTGSCRGCSCAVSARACESCYPGRAGRCRNFGNAQLVPIVPVADPNPAFHSDRSPERPGFLGRRRRSSPGAVGRGRSHARDGSASRSPVARVPGRIAAMNVPSRDSRDPSSRDDSAPVSEPVPRPGAPDVAPRSAVGSEPVSNAPGARGSVPDPGPDPAAAAAAAVTTESVLSAYEEVITWRRNLFIVPHGAVGRRFVALLADLMHSFAVGGAARRHAWAAVVVASQLLLQKPCATQYGASAPHLDRRLGLWESGRIGELLREGRCLQAHLPPLRDSGPREADGQIDDMRFSKLVFSGRIQSAIRLASSASSGGVLAMDEVMDADTGKTVRDALLEKHPSPASPDPSVLVDAADRPECDPILFERLTPALIKRVAREMSGSSGPSGLDAEAWQRMLTCYGACSDRLASSMAETARLLCREDVDPDSLAAFTAARLIPLNKNPGVRPIAVGEVFRRIVCKAVARVIEPDMLMVTAPLQLCAGVPSGCEAAVHAMEHLFEQPATEAILLVDAGNAFNSLNRAVAMHNVPVVCPPLGQIFHNTYRSPSRLFVAGGGEVLSREGTCQGDPLAMGIYAVAITPLIRRLGELCPDIVQEWYADDDSAAGRVRSLLRYWNSVKELGPAYGYTPNPTKTVLLVKEECLEEASTLFAGTGIKIITSGCRYLGGVLGTGSFKAAYLEEAVSAWCKQVVNLVSVARTQPHAVYATLQGVYSKWRYVLRVASCPPALLERLDTLVNRDLLPLLLGREVPDEASLRRLLSVPTRLGGLNIPILAAEAEREYSTSVAVTEPLVRLMVGDGSGSAVPDGEEVSLASPQNPPLSVASASAASVPDGEEVSLASHRNPPLSVASASAASSAASVRDPPGPVTRPEPGVHTTQPVRDNPSVAAVTESRKRAVSRRKDKEKSQKALVAALYPDLPPPQKCLTDIAGEKGVSSWLTCAPLTAHRTILNKSDFRDAVCIRYGYLPLDVPCKCACGADTTLHHSMTCPHGGYPMARHDEIRDTLAAVLGDVVPDVEVEPRLLPLDGEVLAGRTANRSAEARLDIRAGGFWTRQQDAFFDVRVTHPKASLLSRSEALGQLRTSELEKKRKYCQRITDVERGAFTPLVFATNGMAGAECGMFLKRLVQRVVEKHSDLQYSVVMHHLRAKIAFCLLRWAVTCLRGCRGARGVRRGNSFVTECRLLR